MPPSGWPDILCTTEMSPKPAFPRAHRGRRGGRSQHQSLKTLLRKVYWGAWGVDKNTSIFINVISKILISKYTCPSYHPPTTLTFHSEPFTTKSHNQRGTRHLCPVRPWNMRVRWWGWGETQASRNSDHGEHQSQQISEEKLHSAHREGEASPPPDL